MNLPNAITFGRLVLTAVCFVLLAIAEAAPEPPGATAWWAFALFLVAAVSDFVDGWLARRYGQVTALGRVADPFADKVLICGTFVLLLDFPHVEAVLPAWFVVVVVARELLVTTVRGLAEAAGIAFPAERLGKWKMVAQCATAAAMLTMVAGTTVWAPVAEWGMWVTLVLTAWSGAGYVWKARRLLGGA